MCNNEVKVRENKLNERGREVGRCAGEDTITPPYHPTCSGVMNCDQGVSWEPVIDRRSLMPEHEHKQKRREENLMSIESAKAFLERVGNDEDFRKELEGKTSLEERIKFAKAQGFDFTKGEFRECMDSLSDEDLDAVAAGSWKELGEGIFDASGGWVLCSILENYMSA